LAHDGHRYPESVRRLLLPLTVGFVTALVLVAAVGLYSARTLSDSFLYLPDPAQEAAPVISVAGEAKDPPPDAPGVLFVAVTRRRATLLESWFSSMRERGSQLVPEQLVIPPGQTPEQRRREDEADMSQSQRVAAAVALRKLGREVKITGDGARVAEVVPQTPASDAGLLSGDVIVEANGTAVKTASDLRAIVQKLQPGQKVALKVRREGEAQPVTITSGTIASPEDASRAVMGVRIEDDAQITLPVDVKYATESIGGPSAGLPFALEIYNALSNRSLVRGHRIAATGEILLDGTVSEIGAAEQKAIGAREAGADVFLVPAGNLEAAQKSAPDGLKVIPVRTFDEAIAAIQALPPADDATRQASR
jgi:PDZ domain-containing protein